MSSMIICQQKLIINLKGLPYICMKKLFLIFFSYFFLIISIQADDIKDFQIEGISIGDSLLNFYSKKEINEGTNNNATYKSDEFLMVTLLPSGNTYEALQFHIKKNDKNYIIHSISGQNSIKLKACLLERDKIFEELKVLFPNTRLIKLNKRDHPGFENSYSYSSYFKFKSGDLIEIACYDFSDLINKEGWNDYLTISLDSKEFNKFLLNAY